MTNRRGLGLLLGLAVLTGGPASAQTSGAPPGVAVNPVPPQGPTTVAGSDENLTVLGHHSRFQPAPVPGAALGPPPDKPAMHLGRYKISGDQTPKDGVDAQTGAQIGQFGTAYTNASPVANGLASRFGH